MPEVMPGTISTGMPSLTRSSSSSPPRPKMKGSPPFNRTIRSYWCAFWMISLVVSSWSRECWPLRLPA